MCIVLRVAVLMIVPLMVVSCMRDHRSREEGRIVNAKSATVLDGGSYAVDLFFAPTGKVLRLFIANPTRRKGPGESVWIADENGEPKEVLHRASQLGEQLRKQLNKARVDTDVAAETKNICSMLEQLLADPDLPWKQVVFMEKWE